MSDDIQTTEPPVKKQKLEHVDSEKLEDISKNAVSENDYSNDVGAPEAVVKDFDVSEDKYKDFVTHEELEKLREFKVLDEVKSNDEDSNDEESDSSDGKSEDLPEDEIERMLNEDMPEDFKAVPKPKEKPYITRQKIVLEEKGINQFEVLPLDWMMARHYSGMPIYMHRATRVCTLSKPYFLGKGNTRRHDIPISAIPCLAYRKALEEEAKQKEIDKQIDDQIKNGTWQQNKDKTIANHQNNKNKINENIKNNTEINDSSTVTVNNDTTETKKPKCPFLHKIGTKNTVLVDNHDDNTQNIENSTCHTNMKGTKEIEVCIETDEVLFTRKEEESSTENKLESNDIVSSENEDFAIVKHIDEKFAKDIHTNKTEPSTVADDNLDTATEQKVKANIDLDIPTESNTKNELISELNDLDIVTNDSEVNSEVINEDVEIPLNRQPVVLPGGIVMPPPRVETVSTSWKTQHLTHEQVNEYCKRLFKFKTVNIMHFKRWADRRKYTKARKTLQYPTLPEGTKLITIPAHAGAGGGHDGQGAGGGGKANKRDWVMNMNGRSYLSVFHEYVRRALQKQPVYEFKQLENASTPYQATVYIGGMQYGVGHGSSKRSAKSAAARASIHILIPEMRADLDPPPPPGRAQPPAPAHEPDFTFFDYVGIEDPRITEFCAATCEPAPHAILRTCLLRNFGAGDRHIHTEMKKLEYQKMELTMKVGKHSATVVCKNKKTAKQRASQAILQALHPHVRSWGSLLRLYGSRSVKSCKEKKVEEQQITLLQDAARHNEPNYAVLDKLRAEMGKLRARDAALAPVGTLLLRAQLPTHSGSNLDNVHL